MHLDLATTSMLAGMMLNETPALNTLTPDEARLVFSEINCSMPPGPAQVSSREVEIPVGGGSIRGRVLTPSIPPKSLMVYYHGGWALATSTITTRWADTLQRSVTQLSSWSTIERPQSTHSQHRSMTAMPRLSGLTIIEGI